MIGAANLGAFIAQVPHHVGYELDGHITVIPVRATGQPVVLATSPWESNLETSDTRAEFAESVTEVARREGEGERFVIIGWGAGGAQRAELSNDTFLQAARAPDTLLVHVQDGAWRQSVTGAPWGEWHDLPNLDAYSVSAGRVQPARTRKELGDRYEPGPAVFADQAPQGLTWTDHAPRFRAQMAQRTLARLAEPGHGHDPGRMATVAHLMVTDRAVRDAVLIDAAADRARTDALVRIYQGAPEQLRGSLAAAAGTALYLSGEHPVAAEAVLAHSQDRLAELTRTASRLGMNPLTVQKELTVQLETSLSTADETWHQQQATHGVRPHPQPPSTLDSAAAGPTPGLSL